LRFLQTINPLAFVGDIISLRNIPQFKRLPDEGGERWMLGPRGGSGILGTFFWAAETRIRAGFGEHDRVSITYESFAEESKRRGTIVGWKKKK
jgi:hypothetical protein